MERRQNGLTADFQYSKKARFSVGGQIVYFSKIRHYIFRNTESRFLCLKYIESASFEPRGHKWNINEADSMSTRHKNMLGAPPSMPAGAFTSPKNGPYIFWTHNIAIFISVSNT